MKRISTYIFAMNSLLAVPGIHAAGPVLASAPLHRQVHVDSTLFSKTDYASLSRGEVRVFSDVLAKEVQFSKHPYFSAVSVVDRAGDLKKVAGTVYVAVTKVRFVVQKPVEFFSVRRLSDLSFIKAWLGSPNIQRLNADTIRVPAESDAPGFDQVIDVYEGADQINRSVPALLALNKELGTPRVIRFIEARNYTKILKLDTTYSNQMSTAFYAAPNRNETIIVQTAVSYLHNVPPKLLGGIERIKTGIQKAFLDSAKNLDRIKAD